MKLRMVSPRNSLGLFLWTLLIQLFDTPPRPYLKFVDITVPHLESRLLTLTVRHSMRLSGRAYVTQRFF